MLLFSSCRRGNDASNHVTWDFDASTMVRPTKSTEDGADSNSASSAAASSTIPTTATAAASNQRTNDQDSLTPTESNHKVPFSEGEGKGEELQVSPQLGIDDTAMVLESGSRKSIVEGAAEKRNSVVLVGEDGVDGHIAVGHEKASLCVPVGRCSGVLHVISLKSTIFARIRAMGCHQSADSAV